MVSIIRLLSGDPWDKIRWLEEQEHGAADEIEVPLPELLRLIRQHGVPKDLGGYVADRLTKKRPRHRPKQTWKDRLAAQRRAEKLAAEVTLEQARQRIEGARSARPVALSIVAKRNNMAPSSLASLIKKGKRNAWLEWRAPSLAEAVAFLQNQKRRGKKAKH